LEKQKALYAATVERLSNPKETTVVLVSRPERASLREAERTRAELGDLGVSNLQLVVNGVFVAKEWGDAIADAMTQRAVESLSEMPVGLAALPGSTIPFLPKGTVGLEALRAMAHPEELPLPLERSLPAIDSLPGGLKRYVDELAAVGHGVIMTMGKGGVGKTSVAAAIAFNLAARGFPVILSTTDPAAHVSAAAEEGMPGLTVTKIDPAQEVREYTEEVLAKAGKSLDAAGLALLEEDLRSPCTEEIAVFRAFARTVDEGKGGFVVLDTAPTGHTILLLDAAEAYHREVERTQGDMPESVKELLPRLRDKNFTHVFVATLPEATPVHEAERLQNDLRRAGIEPYAWVINQSLLASGTRDPVLMERGAYELPYIETVANKLSARCALIPWLSQQPTGKSGLASLII
jgi:arsenite-transporting ATPase